MPKKEKRPLPKRDDKKKEEKAPSSPGQDKDFQLPEDEIGNIVDDAIKGTEQELAGNRQTGAQ